MTDKIIDLHTHSTKSDGTMTPSELARHAKDIGLSAIALTDHDTNAGCAEFLTECERLGIEGIPGVELSAKYKRALHIVGLYAGGAELDEMLNKLKNSRAKRNRDMLRKIQALGFDISEDDITNAELGVTMDTTGRLYMADAFVKKGFAADRQDAFDRYLLKGRPCYESRFSFTPKESISLIKRNGGIAVWAHPVYAVDTYEEMTELAAELKSYGLDAMECYYSEYTDEQSEQCRRIAAELDIKMSGGSDFHGANKPRVKLGEVNGGHVPYSVLRKLKETRAGA